MIEFLKIRDVKSPKRRFGDGGIDLFIPNKTDDFIKQLALVNDNVTYNKDGLISIKPHQDILIPSGIKSKFNSNMILSAENKSGIAFKKKLITGAKIIDSSYQGEIHIHLINTSDNFVTLNYGEKITQLIPVLINAAPHRTYENIKESEFYTEQTERGSGGFGSTNK